ncbi:MAG: lipopolysaccharide transport periplasmic protein LptA [Gammaproteobacteria bacterium]|nr:lipopolysaccharide transport periplasmic protein LptA [Gammaproteobacteria bacterium]
MNRFISTTLLLVGLATFTFASERSLIEADKMIWQEARGVTTFSGTVRYRYPAKNITLLADKLEVRRQSKKLISVIAEGNPVIFEQLAEADKLIKGRSSHLYYDAQTEMIKLSGAAELISGNNTLRGEVIVYDVQNQTAEVSGDGQDNGRFEAIITPSSKPMKNHNDNP